MVGKKESDKKAKFLSTDLDIEYFELLDNLIAEKRLGSRREGLTVVFKGYLNHSIPLPLKLTLQFASSYQMINPSVARIETKSKKYQPKNVMLAKKPRKPLKKTSAWKS